MLPDEEKTFKDLKDKQDRQEFQKIFWARRDLDLETPANESQAEYEKARAAADQKYKVGGRSGSQTDCGRVSILLGEPAEVKKQPVKVARPRGPARSGSTGAPISGAGGDIPLTGVPSAAVNFNQQLNRVAESRIAHRSPTTARGTGTSQSWRPARSPAFPDPAQDAPPGLSHRHRGGLHQGAGGGTMLLGRPRRGRASPPESGAEDRQGHRLRRGLGRDGNITPRVTYDVEWPQTALHGGVRLGSGPEIHPEGWRLDEASHKGSVATVSVEVPDLNKGVCDEHADAAERFR
jgi:GWxTD domain-containing protein